LYARVPVLLINPTSYHEQLSRHAGLATIGSDQKILAATQKSFAKLYKSCVEKSEQAALRWGLVPEQNKSLSGLLLGTQPVVHRQCPLCGTTADRIAGRFPERTYRYCSCGTFIMDRLTPPPMEYNRDYFFAEYQKQYGKTYLEDFPQLKKVGARRLREISALLDVTRNAFNTQTADLTRNSPNTQTADFMRISLNTPASDLTRNALNAPATPAVKRLLDIGCAYGPFLAAARDSGFVAIGIDPAADAVEYVKKTLGINAVHGTFPESLSELAAAGTEKKSGAFDVITLWYVLEHFEDPGKALRATNGLLKTGGVLAFSTPSAAGISRRRSLRAFLEKSPADHWTIWDPRRTAAILARYGFCLKKRVTSGHHPERFPPVFAALRVLKIPQALSRIFGLGDTFEAYAVKVSDCERENHV
jgi:2-polyprenyl-3-methyl-5-hydroxy-6-metoxy-1,4-benzoquinol methylase